MLLKTVENISKRKNSRALTRLNPPQAGLLPTHAKAVRAEIVEMFWKQEGPFAAKKPGLKAIQVRNIGEQISPRL